jgi:hypothetical protein
MECVELVYEKLNRALFMSFRSLLVCTMEWISII